MNPKVSIIIPVYNAEKYLRECFDSLKSQTFSDFEVVLSDDGSSDGSLEIIKEYCETDKRFRLLALSHRGVANARNAAILSAVGEFIAFVDSDDYIDPEFLSQLMDKADYDLVVCGYFVESRNSENRIISNRMVTPDKFVYEFKDSSDKSKIEQELSHGLLHINCIKLFKRELIVSNNITFPDYPVNEDFIFTLRYLKYAKNISFISKPLYYWVRRCNVQSAVESIPINIVEIYTEAHKNLADVFQDSSMAERISSLSYDLILHKCYQAQYIKNISKFECNKIIRSLRNNKMVCRSFLKTKQNSKFITLSRLFFILRLHNLNYLLYKAFIFSK